MTLLIDPLFLVLSPKLKKTGMRYGIAPPAQIAEIGLTSDLGHFFLT